MKLTPLQKRNLAALLAQRGTGPGVGRTLARAKLFCAAHLILVAGGVFYIQEGGNWQLIGCSLIGLAVGSFFRLVRITVSAKRVWPLTVQLIDWEKAEALARRADHSAPPLPN